MRKVLEKQCFRSFTKATVKLIGAGIMVFLGFLLIPGKALAQTEVKNTDAYSTIQNDLKQDRLADALRRIQMLEQENRFLSKRIELLERNVNDIKNDRY